MKKIRYLLPLVFGTLLMMPASSSAALNAYLRLTGETQSEIQGSVTQSGREDSIAVYGYNHTIVSPRDASSGLPSGKRQHKPISLILHVDKATPALYSALVNNENITTFRLEFWRPSRTGVEEQYYTIELQNASIAAIRGYVSYNKDPAFMRYPETIEVSFAYQKIIWTYEDGGITAEDDWETPVAVAPAGSDK